METMDASLTEPDAVLAVTVAALPEELLRLVLQHLLGDAPLEAYPLLKMWESFALACKAWLEVARRTPLRINLGDLVELDDDAIDWLSGVTLEELELSPAHFTIDLFRHRPQFVERSGRTLRRLLGAQVAADPDDALIPANFPNLEELDLHSDEEARAGHHFDAGCLASLQHLTALTLSEFVTADLTALPTALRQLDLMVYNNEPVRLPPELRLDRLALTGSTMYVPWGELCRTVRDYLAITAPLVSLLLPAGAPAPASEAEASLVALTRGFLEGRVTHAEVTLNHLELVVPDPDAVREKGQHYFPAPAYNPDDPNPAHPWFRTLHSVDQLGVQAYLGDNPHARQFGTFFQPDTPENEDEIGLFNGTRFELVRHAPGEPLQLGFAHELLDHQMEFLLSGVQVKRLALEHVPPSQVAALLNSRAFQQSSASTLRLLEGVELQPGLELEPYSALEELVAYVGGAVELGPHVLPANLVHLELCADTQPPALDGVDPMVWQEQLLDQLNWGANWQGGEPPPGPPPPQQQQQQQGPAAAAGVPGMAAAAAAAAGAQPAIAAVDGGAGGAAAAPIGQLDPPMLRFDAAAALGHMRQLRDLCLTAFHDMDLRQLPPSVSTVLIQDPDFQHPMTRGLPEPYRLALPRALPPGRLSLEVNLRFSPTSPSPVAGKSCWPPLVQLDELMAGGVTHVGIEVGDGGPPASSEEEEEEEAGGGPGQPGRRVESWVLTVQCQGGSLQAVMGAVTASPLQSITFDAAVVRFQGGVAPGEGGAAVAPRRGGIGGAGPPTISSLQMQEYIEAEWSEHWRVIPLDMAEGSELEDVEEASEYEEEDGGSSGDSGSEGGGEGSEDELSGSSGGSRGFGDAFTLKRR